MTLKPDFIPSPRWMDAIDVAARRKIASLKRGVVEGSAEWNILYRRYRDEELRKRGPRSS